MNQPTSTRSFPSKYPVGVQTFREIREEGYLYIDKTEYIAKLLNGKYYFLSRPRRFGKSLLLSTIEAYFRGERELFKGLFLDSFTEDWEPHPILHIDLNNGIYDTKEGLIKLLELHISEWENFFAISNENTENYGFNLRFSRVIKEACVKTGKKVVILVDEYDKPLLNAVNDERLSDELRGVLKALYSNLKTMDRYIEFAMLTGVARFSKVSIFSDLNNLNDISFVDEYAGICGITAKEFDLYFHQPLTKLADYLDLDREALKEELKRLYDGYHFTEKSPDVYNPFSIMNVFANRRLDSYWFDSGTPTYLMKLIERGHWRLDKLAPTEIERSKLANAGIQTNNPVPVCFQSGYLTIKEYDPLFKTYMLDYPNEEVKQGFLSFLIPYFIEKNANDGDFSVKRFTMAALQGDADEFMQLMESMIAGVPYSEKGSAEAHFQNAIYLLFTLMGFYTHTEMRTSNGRIDLTVDTEKFLYIFEFKIDSSAEEAMKQILEKKYWLPYVKSNKEIILIGANFDAKERSLSGWIINRL
ncbi:MAG: ATP-binding protein [Muribaculaceae bacterium]|nr:ATP-binding protein [Muribaculaceae bacterium]